MDETALLLNRGYRAPGREARGTADPGRSHSPGRFLSLYSDMALYERKEKGMPRVIVFNHVSLDGFFCDAKGDMSFAHKPPGDKEWEDFVAGNAKGGGMLLFGRVTYDMMASYWPTPMAAANDPVVAESMNALEKVVFSRSMKKADWQNTRVLKGNIAEEVQALKKGRGKDMVIFGSGSIVSQLAQEGVVDDFQLVVNPVVLGKGRSMFDGVKGRVTLRLTGTRVFKNGNVLLSYRPA
jgi:dihydrofolate reductase